MAARTPADATRRWCGEGGSNNRGERCRRRTRRRAREGRLGNGGRPTPPRWKRPREATPSRGTCAPEDEDRPFGSVYWIGIGSTNPFEPMPLRNRFSEVPAEFDRAVSRVREGAWLSWTR